jgi:hypothetical protein
LERHSEPKKAYCAIKGHFSLNPFVKYTKPSNIVNLLLGSLIASLSVLTFHMLRFAATSISLGPISGKSYSTIAVTHTSVSPSTRARIWFDINNKGKEVAFMKEGFTKSFCLG